MTPAPAWSQLGPGLNLNMTLSGRLTPAPTSAPTWPRLTVQSSAPASPRSPGWPRTPTQPRLSPHRSGLVSVPTSDSLQTRSPASPRFSLGLTMAPGSASPPPQPHPGPYHGARPHLDPLCLAALAAVGRDSCSPGLPPAPAPTSPSAAAALMLLRARRWFRSHKMAVLTAATSVPAAAGYAGEWGWPPAPRPLAAAARTRRLREEGGRECCTERTPRPPPRVRSLTSAHARHHLFRLPGLEGRSLCVCALRSCGRCIWKSQPN